MLAQVNQITLIQNVYKKHEYCIKAVCNILVSGINLAIIGALATFWSCACFERAFREDSETGFRAIK